MRANLTKDRDDNVFAHGDLKALITVPCSHCLGPALLKVSVPVNLTFVEPGKDEEEEAAAADPLDDVDVTAHDGREIDLETQLREMLILAVPMSPRCRDNCLGLCPTCGQNKNERDCGHTAPALDDARFSKHSRTSSSTESRKRKAGPWLFRSEGNRRRCATTVARSGCARCRSRP